MLDGPRGAGKTSLMLTLVERWRRVLALEKLDEVLASGEIDLEEIARRDTEPRGVLRAQPERIGVGDLVEPLGIAGA